MKFTNFLCAVAAIGTVSAQHHNGGHPGPNNNGGGQFNNNYGGGNQPFPGQNGNEPFPPQNGNQPFPPQNGGQYGGGNQPFPGQNGNQPFPGQYGGGNQPFPGQYGGGNQPFPGQYGGGNQPFPGQYGGPDPSQFGQGPGGNRPNPGNSQGGPRPQGGYRPMPGGNQPGPDRRGGVMESFITWCTDSWAQKRSCARAAEKVTAAADLIAEATVLDENGSPTVDIVQALAGTSILATDITGTVIFDGTGTGFTDISVEDEDLWKTIRKHGFNYMYSEESNDLLSFTKAVAIRPPAPVSPPVIDPLEELPTGEANQIEQLVQYGISSKTHGGPTNLPPVYLLSVAVPIADDVGKFS